MQSLIVGSIALVLGLTPVAQSGSNGKSDLAAIESFDQCDAAAAKIDDADTLISLWTKNGVLLQPFSDPVVGKAAIEKLLRQQKQASEQAHFKTVAYDEERSERKILGDRAWEWGSITVHTQLPSGKVAPQKAYLLRILARQKHGNWKFERVAVTLGPRPQNASATHE